MGLDAFGWLSDTLARQAADAGASAAEARALGLHRAMYVIPILTALLVPVLFAGLLPQRDTCRGRTGSLVEVFSRE